MSSDSEQKIEPPERLIALIALNSQSLPDSAAREQAESLVLPEGASEEEIAALHARLDADPAAFERFLQQHRTKPASAPVKELSRRFDWLAALRNPLPRYALAFAAALLAVLVALPLFDREPQQVADLERSYAELLSRVGPSAWVLEVPSPASAELGFSPRSRGHDAASFVAGWTMGDRRFREEKIEASEGDLDPYFLLGQWNRLLSVASISDERLPREFWQAQLRRERSLAEMLRAQPGLDPIVATHLARIDASLSSLANGERPARSANELAEELRLFRSGFVERTP